MLIRQMRRCAPDERGALGNCVGQGREPRVLMPTGSGCFVLIALYQIKSLKVSWKMPKKETKKAYTKENKKIVLLCP